MRISDWSSDVCSSDLLTTATTTGARRKRDSSASLATSVSSCEPSCANWRKVSPSVLRTSPRYTMKRQGASLPWSGTRDEKRSEERRVGKVCVSTVRSRGSPGRYKKTRTEQKKV